MKKHIDRQHMNSLFSLIILGIFVLCGIFIIIFGADIYSRLANQATNNNQLRSSLNYVANKVRACPDPENIFILNNTVIIPVDMEGSVYYNGIVFNDGRLVETIADTPQQCTDAQTGETIIIIKEFQADISEDNVLRMEAQTENSGSAELEVSLNY